jgi:hypothetical protein
MNAMTNKSPTDQRFTVKQGFFRMQVRTLESGGSDASPVSAYDYSLPPTFFISEPSPHEELKNVADALLPSLVVVLP